MRALIALAVVALLSFACTTFRPVEETGEALQGRILSGTLIAPRDRIRVVTHDGSEQQFRVAEIRGDGTLVGRGHEVSIETIATLETRELSWIKTGTLLGLLGLAILDSDCEGDPCGPFGGGFFCCP